MIHTGHPIFFLNFYICRLYCKYCQGQYKIFFVVTIFKNVKTNFVLFMSFVTLCNMKKISCLRLRFLKMVQVIF